MLNQILETELDAFGTKNTAELEARRPGAILYAKQKDGTFAETGDYLFPSKIHRFYIDTSSSAKTDTETDVSTRTTGSIDVAVSHDLEKGGSMPVGVMHMRKMADAYDVVRRGFARIVFQRKENGPIEQAYIKCDLSRLCHVSPRHEISLKPFNDTDPDVLWMMSRPGYLNLKYVHLGR